MINQVNNIIRHVGSFAAGAITLASVLAVIDANQAKELATAANEVISGMMQASGGLVKISIVVGPLIAVFMARWGSKAVSTVNQLKSVAKLNDVKVVVGPGAPSAAQKVARDPDLPSVVPGIRL